MELRAVAPKPTGAPGHREFSAAQTFTRVTPYLSTIGVTRIADITWLDRIGIPVYNAIVPRSNDLLSVYSGKGVEAIDAKVSAVMEAAERFSGVLPLRPAVVDSYENLVAAGCTALHPGQLNLALVPRYRDHLPTYWVEGHDLLNEEAVLVPHCAVTLAYDPGAPRCYRLATANGLASGNTLEEAICHALAELIERDAQTIAEVVCSRLSYVLRKGLFGPALSDERVRLLHELHPGIAPDTLTGRARRLSQMFMDAGVHVRLLSITSDLGVPTMMAVSWETSGTAASLAHTGLGTSPDVEVAVTRALTECAQSRAVDFQSTREDFEQADADVPDFQLFARRISRIDTDAWPWRSVSEPVGVGSISSNPSDDVVEDLRFMLDRVSAGGLDRVIAVDLSPPGMPVSVARVLVPGLESWASDRSKLGHRATSAWNDAVRRIAEPQARTTARVAVT
jgi:ribosomal protein S12 methylthiotransferase accessory factor